LPGGTFQIFGIASNFSEMQNRFLAGGLSTSADSAYNSRGTNFVKVLGR
jgi:hypothetical protein